MRKPIIQPGELAAAVMIGGGLVIVLPRHALSIIQLVVLTVGVVAGLYALAVNVPETGWMSPFRWMSPFGRLHRREGGRNGQNEIGSIRSKLSGWRQPVRGAPPLPPEVLGLLRPLIRDSLDLDPLNESDWESARVHLSPLSWAILTHDPSGLANLVSLIPPYRTGVAHVVHAVLDELDVITSGAGNTGHQRTTIDHD